MLYEPLPKSDFYISVYNLFAEDLERKPKLFSTSEVGSDFFYSVL
jgi:hypothetical protein